MIDNLTSEGRRREFGRAEGVIPAAGSGGDGAKPPNGSLSPAPSAGDNAGQWFGRLPKSALADISSRRYDFRNATVRVTEGFDQPVNYDLGTSARYVQSFDVDVPSTPAPLDFIVRVFYRTSEALPKGNGGDGGRNRTRAASRYSIPSNNKAGARRRETCRGRAQSRMERRTLRI